MDGIDKMWYLVNLLSALAQGDFSSPASVMIKLLSTTELRRCRRTMLGLVWVDLE